MWLLDVNVLLALVDPANLHHERAHGWVAAHWDRLEWATCALTENGFCRVLSSTGYPGATTPRKAMEALAGLRDGLPGHRFWPCDLSIVEDGCFDWGLVQGSQQITDLYLLGLAVRNGARLVTFDQRVRWRLVRGAGPEAVEVLSGGR